MNICSEFVMKLNLRKFDKSLTISNETAEFASIFMVALVCWNKKMFINRLANSSKTFEPFLLEA